MRRLPLVARAGGRSLENSSSGTNSIPPRRRRRIEDAELRDAVEEGISQIRAEFSQPEYVEAERATRQEAEERARTKEAAEEVFLSADQCSKCDGTGIEWSCSKCAAEGFILSKSEDGSPLWKTCESCRGEGSKPCPACVAPDLDDDIIRNPTW